MKYTKHIQAQISPPGYRDISTSSVGPWKCEALFTKLEQLRAASEYWNVLINTITQKLNFSKVEIILRVTKTGALIYITQCNRQAGLVCAWTHTQHLSYMRLYFSEVILLKSLQAILVPGHTPFYTFRFLRNHTPFKIPFIFLFTLSSLSISFLSWLDYLTVWIIYSAQYNDYSIDQENISESISFL